MLFSIIIPNLNGENYLKTCLPSIKKSLQKANLKNYELILVDNASKDQSINLTKEIFPKAIFIKNKKNLGFAPAVNQGIKKSRGEWVIILNNDLTLNQNWFQEIKKNIEKHKNNPNLVTFFGQVLNKDKTHVESQGLKFFIKGKALNTNNKKPYQTKNENSCLIWGASASAIVYHRKTLLDVGLFDQDFFAYEEDVDLSLRLHLLGYQTLYIPTAISYHLGGGTSSKMGNFRMRMDTKNWFFIIIKNYPSKTILKNFFPILIERGRNLSGLCKETIKIHGAKSIYILPLSIIKTYSQLLIKLPVMLKKRHVIQKKIKKEI